MATNLQLEEKLLERVVKLSGKKTKKAAVTDALEEYVRRREQMKILDSFSTVVFDPDFAMTAWEQEGHGRGSRRRLDQHLDEDSRTGRDLHDL